jgi:hypothetical protein
MSKKRPAKFPQWASELVKNDINKEYNKYEPPTEKKKSGWELGEVPPRQWVNYQADLTNTWLEYLASQSNKASIYTTKKDLPKAKKSLGGLAFIKDTESLAFSDGKTWKKLKTEEL